MVETVRQVFTERNITVMSLTSIIFQVVNFIWQTWWSLYLLELGATPEIVGFFAILQEAPRMLVQLPGGLLADRFGRKKMLVYCTGLRAIPPILYLFARTWQQLIPIVIFDAAVWGLYMPAWQALIAESLPYRKRGAAFGVFNTVNAIPRIFLPVLTGMLLDQIGVIMSIRIGFILKMIGPVVSALVRAILLKETLTVVDTGIKSSNFREAFSGLSKLRGSILAMLIVGVISSFVMRMVQPFLVVYAVNIIELTKTQWGTIQTALGIISAILALPGGMFSDRFGRRLSILTARFLSPFNWLSLLLLRDFNQILLLQILIGIGIGLSGGGNIAMGGPAWNALITDLVPSSDRGKVMGLMSMVSGIVGMPSSIIGGYIWTSFSPNVLLASSFFAGMVPVLIFHLFVKEPKTRER